MVYGFWRVASIKFRSQKNGGEVLFLAMGLCRNFNLFLWLVLLCLAPRPNIRAQEELPFWRLRKNLYQQIVDSRRVVVSVRPHQGAKDVLGFQGVGVVSAPPYYCAERVMAFEDLADLSSYFKVIRHLPKKKQLYLHIGVLGFETRMRIRYRVVQKIGKPWKLEWKVIWGKLEGMVGQFELLSLAGNKTEISMWSRFVATKVPLPKLFMTFTLEVIAEKVAQKMRTSIEKGFRERLRDVGK